MPLKQVLNTECILKITLGLRHYAVLCYLLRGIVNFLLSFQISYVFTHLELQPDKTFQSSEASNSNKGSNILRRK